MRITLNHPSAIHGRPAILDQDDEPMETVEGARAVLNYIGLSGKDYAEKCGYSSYRSLRPWLKERRTLPPVAAINVLWVELDKFKSRQRRRLRKGKATQ